MLRSMMFLCMGASAVLLGIQWRTWAAGSVVEPASNPVSQELIRATAISKGVIAQKTALASQALLAKQVALVDTPNLVVDLSDRRVYLYKGKQLETDYPLAVGQAGWETPTGSFQVVEMQEEPEWLHPITKEVVPPGPSNPLGKRWIGFWSDGNTHLGFHGTNQEELLGQAVSHGCLRMRNADAVALYDQVEIGTPVLIRP